MTQNRLVQALTSLKLTILCLALAMMIIFLGTIAQVDMGTFAAQKVYFNHFFLYGPTLGSFRIPIFPGGLLVGLLWFVNLCAVLIFRMRYSKQNAGLLLVHYGLLLLLLGQFFTQTWGRESRLGFEEGETRNYIENSQRLELAVIMVSDPEKDNVVCIPESHLKEKHRIQTPHLPFSLNIQKVLQNSAMRMKKPDEPALVTQGVGQQLSVEELPFTTKDDEINNMTVIFEIEKEAQSLGTWLVSLQLGSPQPLLVDGKTYQFFLRPRREHLPFQMTLKDFKHDRYPGTDIPKNFSSLVQLVDPTRNENREITIYMNHPLRYGGLTFYQASFGKDDRMSILQVVKNRAWLTPYISCIMVVLGLAIQFLMHLGRFRRRKMA